MPSHLLSMPPTLCLLLFHVWKKFILRETDSSSSVNMKLTNIWQCYVLHTKQNNCLSRFILANTFKIGFFGVVGMSLVFFSLDYHFFRSSPQMSSHLFSLSLSLINMKLLGQHDLSLLYMWNIYYHENVITTVPKLDISQAKIRCHLTLFGAAVNVLMLPW